MPDFIVAIDPGNVQSAFVITDAHLNPLRFGKADNEFMYITLCDCFVELNCQPENTAIVIEWVKSYGMPVGESVFETCVWIGKLEERFKAYGTNRINRSQEKSIICHDSRANDATIRRALIDEFAPDVPNNGKGTKKQPGFFYGFKADIWQAFAIAYTFGKLWGCI